MIDATVHMIARNSADFVKPCLESVLPYVKKAIISIDDNSTDGTLERVVRLAKKHSNLNVEICEVLYPLIDLVKMRNSQLEKAKTEWIWVVDSDEFYPLEVIQEIEEAVKSSDYDCLALMSWAIWNRKQHHVSTSKIPAGRLFRRLPDMEWRGSFGKEKLYSGSYLLWSDQNSRVKYLNGRYVHLTHVKQDYWRKELGQVRLADGRRLGNLPPEIINYVNYIYENS